MHPADRFRRVFARVSADTPVPVPELYAPAVVFRDPAHHVEGREALQRYFDRLDRNVCEGRFDFTRELRGEGTACLEWTLTLSLRAGPRRPVVVPGTSWLEHDGTLVTHQHDHYDLGALVYEQVPVLGTLVRWIRRAL